MSDELRREAGIVLDNKTGWSATRKGEAAKRLARACLTAHPADGVTTNSVSQSYSAPETREPMRLIQDDDSHWYIIPVAKVDEFYAWCKSMEKCTDPPSDWEPEQINGPHMLHIFDWEEA